MRKIIDQDELQQVAEQHKLYHKRFSNCIFSGLDMQEWVLSGVRFEACIFVACRFSQTELKFVRFQNCRFYQSELSNCELEFCSIVSCELADCVLHDCTLRHCVLVNITNSSAFEMRVCTIDGGSMARCSFNAAARFVDNHSIELFCADQAQATTSFKVALIGAPMNGKSSLLQGLRAVLQADPIEQVLLSEFFASIECNAEIMGRSVRFRTSPGSPLWEPLRLIWLLADADLVVYVASLRPGDEQLMADYFKREILPLLNPLQKTWHDVPWILVLNKVDLRDADFVRTGVTSIIYQDTPLFQAINGDIPVVLSSADYRIGVHEIVDHLSELIQAKE